MLRLQEEILKAAHPAMIPTELIRLALTAILILTVFKERILKLIDSALEANAMVEVAAGEDQPAGVG